MGATPRNRTAGKKSKRKDERPARKRYWMKRVLEKKKVKRIFDGMLKAFLREKRKKTTTPAETKKLRRLALEKWHKVRTTRVPDGFIPKVYS